MRLWYNEFGRTLHQNTANIIIIIVVVVVSGVMTVLQQHRS